MPILNMGEKKEIKNRTEIIKLCKAHRASKRLLETKLGLLDTRSCFYFATLVVCLTLIKCIKGFTLIIKCCFLN